jgi:hypothetical protein
MWLAAATQLIFVRAKTRRRRLLIAIGPGKRFSGRLRLWFLLMLVPAECLLWRFPSHSEHSSLLLAADLLKDYDSLKRGHGNDGTP